MKFADTGPGAVLTVSQLLLRATNALVSELGSVAVEGEISSFHHHRNSGHMYWTLKDGASEVRCVMFRSDNRRLTASPEDGSHVVVVARPTIYQSRGQFQLQVTELLARGHGALHLRFEALRKKLAAEGLFDEEKKQDLPFWPLRVGVVTSSEGAALRDIVTVLRRRAPGTEVVLRAVPVQGREAAEEIAQGVRWFSDHPDVDVVIVGRGGGSLEDLWAFNEEAVVRAVASCAVPIVCAVGHETDTTLSDYAADVRAPTPSAAAERVVPEVREIAAVFSTTTRRLTRALVRQRQRRVDEALAPIRRYGFRRVRDRLRDTQQRWGDDLESLVRPLAGKMAAAGRTSSVGTQRLSRRLATYLSLDREVATRVATLVRSVAVQRERLVVGHAHVERRLKAVSPLAILDRGYAVVTDHGGAIAKDAGAVPIGEMIGVRLARGHLKARVEEKALSHEEVEK